jgi:hypothetical protein
MIGSSRNAVSKSCSRLCPVGQGKERRIRAENRNYNVEIFRGCHKKEFPNKFNIINWQEDIVQEAKEENGLIFEDGADSQIDGRDHEDDDEK